MRTTVVDGPRHWTLSCHPSFLSAKEEVRKTKDKTCEGLIVLTQATMGSYNDHNEHMVVDATTHLVISDHTTKEVFRAPLFGTVACHVTNDTPDPQRPPKILRPPSILFLPTKRVAQPQDATFLVVISPPLGVA